MTDNEIIKALECCISDDYTCKECPYADTKHMIGDEYELMPNGRTYDEFSCDEWLKLDLFDLINRLQAENENYSKNNQTMTSDILKLYKELEQAKAENERLKDYNDNLQTANTSLSNEILDVKAEAYKECIEKVRKIFSLIKRECRNNLDNDGAFAIERARKKVDNLLKEMVGENDVNEKAKE